MEKLEKILKIAIIAMLAVIVLYAAKTVFLSDDNGNVSIITKDSVVKNIDTNPKDVNYADKFINDLKNIVILCHPEETPENLEYILFLPFSLKYVGFGSSNPMEEIDFAGETIKSSKIYFVRYDQVLEKDIIEVLKLDYYWHGKEISYDSSKILYGTLMDLIQMIEGKTGVDFSIDPYTSCILEKSQKNLYQINNLNPDNLLNFLKLVLEKNKVKIVNVDDKNYDVIDENKSFEESGKIYESDRPYISKKENENQEPSETIETTDTNKLLFRAIKKSEYSTVENLLKEGADINTSDSMGRTPIMLAVRDKNRQMVELLLKYNPDLSLKNKKGNNVYILAKKFNLDDILPKPANEFANDSDYSTSLLPLEEKTAVPDAERIDKIRTSISKLIGHDNKMDLVLINSHQGEMRFKFCPGENFLELEGVTIDEYPYYEVKNKSGGKIDKNDIQNVICYEAKSQILEREKCLTMSSNGLVGIINMCSEYQLLNFAISDETSRRILSNMSCKINLDGLSNEQIAVFVKYILEKNNLKLKYLEDNIYKIYSDQPESPNNIPFPIPKSKDFRFPGDPSPPPPSQRGRFIKK